MTSMLVRPRCCSWNPLHDTTTAETHPRMLIGVGTATAEKKNSLQAFRHQSHLMCKLAYPTRNNTFMDASDLDFFSWRKVEHLHCMPMVFIGFKMVTPLLNACQRNASPSVWDCYKCCSYIEMQCSICVCVLCVYV